MRIAITNWSNRVTGGAEQYIASVSAAFSRAGHEVALFHETDQPANRPQLDLPTMQPTGEPLATTFLAALRQWQPDVIYGHGLQDPELELQSLEVAPSVFFAHNYYGTCISGYKATQVPVLQPCTRVFGPSCLARFYPLRCGGLNPRTMLRDYAISARRLQVLRRYTRVVSHTTAMTAEYQRHRINCQSVGFFVHLESTLVRSVESRTEWQLLMLGRMTPLKGGRMLLDALPAVQQQLQRPIVLVLAGDGPSRADWEAQAASIMARTPQLRVEFPGWLADDARLQVLAAADLLVMPSLWPEPFGMSGPEAGRMGVPTAAFALGGIKDWLHDGVNGHLAPANPPTAAGLAKAIGSCLASPEHYAALRQAAWQQSQSWNLASHYKQLEAVLYAVSTMAAKV